MADILIIPSEDEYHLNQNAKENHAAAAFVERKVFSKIRRLTEVRYISIASN
jgi:hypothetical protein